MVAEVETQPVSSSVSVFIPHQHTAPETSVGKQDLSTENSTNALYIEKEAWSSSKSNYVLFSFSPFGYFVHLTGHQYLEEMHIPTPTTCKYLTGDEVF